jgi:hypothetical protein
MGKHIQGKCRSGLGYGIILGSLFQGHKPPWGFYRTFNHTPTHPLTARGEN